MKVNVSIVTERRFTLDMSEDEARTLRSLAPNIGYKQITGFGGGHSIAEKGDELFKDISETLRSIL